MQYVKDTQRTALPHIRAITLDNKDHAVILDAATRRNLELTQNLAGGFDNTLASVLDQTATPMGSRLLKRWLHQPIRNPQQLNHRLDAISAFKDTGLFSDVAGVLHHMGDLERILARLALRSARPRDLARMRTALQHLPELAELLAEVEQPRIGELAQFAAPPMDALCELLEHAIIENPPVVIRDGGVLAPGYNTELDEWRDLADGASKYLDDLEIREREHHDIDSLKVGFNQVHGFFIQVSRGQSTWCLAIMSAARH